MTTDSLLGHLATRFASHPENVASESLAFIIDRFPPAKRALLGFVQHLGIQLPTNIVFRTQKSGSDGSIPDLVGSDPENREVLIIEAKFWAGLTDNQPIAYLNRLPADGDGALVIVAPALRICLLWNELVLRCKEARVALGPERQLSSEVIVRSIGGRHLLALVSWRAALTHISRDVAAEGPNLAILSDLQQLQGLCDRMDEDAFLPLQSEELTSTIPIRQMQFCQLVDDLVERSVTEKLASLEGCRSSSGRGAYFRPMFLSGFGCILQVNFDYWARKRSTPIWLSVRDPQWKPTQAVKDALAVLEVEDPPRIIHTDTDLLIPLRLPLGVERPVVLSELIAQIRDVAGLLTRSRENCPQPSAESFAITGSSPTIPPVPRR